MLTDGIISQQLVAGVGDPAVIAMFTLVDAELPAKPAAGLSLSEATALMGSMPFDASVALRCVALRCVATDAGRSSRRDNISFNRTLDCFLAQPR